MKENVDVLMQYAAKLYEVAGLREIALEEKPVYESDAQAYVDGESETVPPPLCLRAGVLQAIRRFNEGRKHGERLIVRLVDIDAVTTPNLGRGCAFGDLDNDGNVDIVVNHLDGAPSVLRNECGNGNGWTLIHCIGTRSNRSAIGARVRVTAGGLVQMGEVMSGSGYYSHNDLRLHFGLGQAKTIEWIEVNWPSGVKLSLRDKNVNQIIRIEEPRG